MFVSFGKMVILWLKEVFRDSKSPPLEELTKLFKYLMEIDLSHEWQTVTSTIFILKYFQHVCKLWQNGYFYDLKKSSEILKVHLRTFRRADQTV
jgi:hypothetical protein